MADKPQKPKDDVSGHRQRLRNKFLEAGPGALADYEMLELILFLAQPRGDTKPLAKQLIARFGSYAAVISAEPKELKEITGIGDAAVVFFSVALGMGTGLPVWQLGFMQTALGPRVVAGIFGWVAGRVVC